MTQVLLKSFALLLLATSGAYAQSALKPAGCWKLSFSPWNPPVTRGDESLYSPLPDSVDFTTRQADHGYFQVRRRPNRVPPILRSNIDSLSAFWKGTGGDSLELWLPVWWSTGIRVQLQQRGDSLNGEARIYVDVVGIPVPQSRVTGTRLSCWRGA